MVLFSSQSRVDDLSSMALESEFDFKVKIRKSLRAKRITLRVCHVTGELKITIPPKLQMSVLRKFIDKNTNWIRSKLNKFSPSVIITEGILLPIIGQNRRILVDTNLVSSYLLKETELLLPKTKNPFEVQLKLVLKKIAEDYFTATCADYANRLDVEFLKISVRDPISRWGSCSSDKKLMFSWRLIMAPLEVSSYVAAHEIAHLLQMNHSRKFWAVVSSISPNYCNQRNWLRENGRNLHKFVL
jgi:hypothetical protein